MITHYYLSMNHIGMTTMQMSAMMMMTPLG